MITKLFHNARIFTPRDSGRPAAGQEQGLLTHFAKGMLLVKNGLIAAVGEEEKVLARLPREEIQQKIDCRGLCMIPGLVDPHTHMCFAGRREGEFEQRLLGTSYLEILNQGGGILASVRAVHEADEETLYAQTCRNASAAMQLGTTTLEIKSGYGLDVDTELKMLRVIDRTAGTLPLDVVPTFLGAHAVPEAFRNHPEAFVELIIRKMLPAVAAQGIARYCDVFCETGVFDLEQSRHILQSAKELGLGVKIHADEVNDLGGAGLAAQLAAISADHLLAASDAGIAALAAAGVVANLLPATAYSLRKPYARARQMIASQLPVALASDCNPGSSFTESMPFVIGLAVLNMLLTPAEALTAATLNAAYAVGMADRVGSLEVGKQADFVLLDGESPAILAYHAGVAPVVAVYKRGELI